MSTDMLRRLTNCRLLLLLLLLLLFCMSADLSATLIRDVWMNFDENVDRSSKRND